MSSPSWLSNPNAQEVDYNCREEENYDYNPTQDSSIKKFSKPSIIGGAAVVGTTAGLIIAGPIVGIVGGVAAAVVATQDSIAGRVARSSGETVLTAGDKVKDFNEKNQIVEKTKWGFGRLARKAGEIDESHQVVERGKRSVNSTIKSAKEVDKKHGIRESINDGFQRHFGFIATKLGRKPNCNYTPWEEDDEKKENDSLERINLEEGNYSNGSSVQHVNGHRHNDNICSSSNFTPWPNQN